MAKVILTFLVMIVLGCDDNAKVHPEDFALNMVNGIIKSDVSDGGSLEERINDPAINNVDTDKDGKTDYIMAKEDVDGSLHHIIYIAHPSSGIGPDVHFAKSTFEQGPDGIEVHSAFLHTVPDYENHYYHDTLGQRLAFSMWLYEVSRPVYIPYVPRTYVYRRRVSVSNFTTVQRNYQVSHNIVVTPRRPRPQSFSHSNPSMSKSSNKTSRSRSSSRR